METCRTYLKYSLTAALRGPRIQPALWARPSSERLLLSLDGDSSR